MFSPIAPRTPLQTRRSLNGIHDFTQAARPDVARTLYEALASEITRCGKIVSNLLEFSRQSSLQVAPTDLNTVIERALFLINHKLELQNIQLTRSLHAGLPEILCDADQIQQALLALLINAIEAMPEGGMLKVTTRPAESSESGAVVFAITDTGCGIPQSQIPRLFEPFFTTKSEQKGVGLGLAVVYGIVQNHGGNIQVHSREGEGTTFEIALPLQTKLDDTTQTPLIEGAVS